MEKYINSLISSIREYVYNLQYLGSDRKHNLRDMHTLIILLELYKSAEWLEYSEQTLIAIRTQIDKIILNNSELVLPEVGELKYYLNVNAPQTIYTWQKVYDQSILSLNPILDENGNIIYGEGGGVLLYESNTIPTSAILDNEGNVILGENQWLLLFENN